MSTHITNSQQAFQGLTAQQPYHTVGNQTNYSGIRDYANSMRSTMYSNQNAYTGGGTGTGSYDFNSVDLTGSGGGGGMDDSLQIDAGIPVTNRNPMLRKNVVSYGCGGKHRSPYKYSDGGIHNQYSRPNIYDQGGMMDPQDGNGIYWQNMAARIGQKNANVALLQTQKIIAGNGRGNPYQMPDQRNMMPNAQYDNGGMMHGGDDSIRGLISSAMQDVNAQMMPAPQKRRFTSGGRF